MSQYGYALIGLTALVGIIAGFLAFAVLRVGAGVRDANKQLKSGSGAETAFLAAALQEAEGKLKAQEKAMSARAEARRDWVDDCAAKPAGGAVILVLSLVFTSMMLALGGGLVLATMAERQAAGAFDRGREAFYAADGALERAISDLSDIDDWSHALDGSVRSTFVDGAAGGGRMLADGIIINLTQLTPPASELFAYGRAGAWLPGGTDSTFYVVCWIADDAADADGDPRRDSNGTVTLTAHAYGLRGTRRMVEATVTHHARGVRLVAWREIRS